MYLIVSDTTTCLYVRTRSGYTCRGVKLMKSFIKVSNLYESDKNKFVVFQETMSLSCLIHPLEMLLSRLSSPARPAQHREEVVTAAIQGNQRGC